MSTIFRGYMSLCLAYIWPYTIFSIPCVFMTLYHWSLNLNKIIWHLVSTPKENKRKIMSICVKLTLFCRIIWKCTMLVSELHTCIIWLSYFRVLLQSMYVHTISNLCCRIGVKMRLDFTIFFNMYIQVIFWNDSSLYYGFLW